MTWWLVVDLLLALLAVGLAAAAWRRTTPRRAVAGEEDLPLDVLALRREVAALQAEGRAALRHVSVVRYDAFPDMGGHQSWSVALLDDEGDGLVLTSVHGRSDARTYAKAIGGWVAEQELSPEERQAVGLARPR
ncbi:MAG: DUF4446 family protein [Nocardioidaceae bacterium]|nr:DUF4446 family protein [Nocardioidaceae bacterium]